ncbi:unnamed protein product [Rotaria magnacalcarata]|uniref:Uncharacterized protein n=1 Tax=Rotaria magnacalcarata TaxID=392030 RepID=A0A8S2M7Q6_9BILA|nr:unnamed protein product [Rotaria magnacalcarata]
MQPSSSLPVAVVRPVQTPSTSITPTSPLNLPSLNVTLPQNKLTTNTTTTTTTTTTMTSNNPAQQLRTAAAFLSNQTQTSSSVQQATQQIRQLFTNANNNSLQTQQTTNTQRLTEAAQRSPSSIQQILASRTASLPGQVRNVRILTFTPGTNPTTGVADTTTTTTTNTQQTPIQSTNITYNRTNSSTASFPRSTINIDQDISPDIAAHVHRIKSFNVTNTDPNDTTPTPRAVLVPARTIPGASASSIGPTSKIKSSSIMDPGTLGFTTKTSQANIVFQLPSTATTRSDEQSTTHSSSLTRQNLLQHLNLISSSMNHRAQSPTTISNATNSITVNRLLQQYHIRAAATLNSSTSTTQLSSGQMNNEQISSSSPTAPPPSSSSSSSSTT